MIEWHISTSHLPNAGKLLSDWWIWIFSCQWLLRVYVVKSSFPTLPLTLSECHQSDQWVVCLALCMCDLMIWSCVVALCFPFSSQWLRLAAVEASEWRQRIEHQHFFGIDWNVCKAPKLSVTQSCNWMFHSLVDYETFNGSKCNKKNIFLLDLWVWKWIFDLGNSTLKTILT